jgi:hypothetical protein
MIFRFFKKIVTFFQTLILFSILWNCSPKQYPDSHFAACYPNHPYDTASFQWKDPVDTIMNALSKRYTRYSLMVANSAGLLDPIREFEREKLKLQVDPSPLQRIKILEKKEIIINRISLFRSQVASAAAELDCEGERADQLSAYLDKIGRNEVRNLTVASIVSGAVGGIASALLNGDQSKTAAITGGTASAVLGLISLSSNKKINFRHPRNLLRDIWFIPQRSITYPTMVWNMLSHITFSNSGEFSVAYYTRKSWQQYWGLKPSDKRADKKIKLLMGEGGLYTADELKLRADMINQLQAAVKLIDQDIQGLLSEVSN